jgi:hypothetical protein
MVSTRKVAFQHLSLRNLALATLPRRLKRYLGHYQIVRTTTLTALIYLSASAAISYLLVSDNPLDGRQFSTPVFLAAPPLLFAFAYSRFALAVSQPNRNRQRLVAMLHGTAAVAPTVLFSVLASQGWNNRLRDIDSLAILSPLVIAAVIFLVAALALLLRKRSTLTGVASFLFWPYWLLLALASVRGFFEETGFYVVFCFLSFVSAALFAFAAGAVFYEPALGHITALTGLVTAPWIYWTDLRDTSLGNLWIFFNLPDGDFQFYSRHARLSVGLIIVSVALTALAVATAALRLLPSRWQFRKQPVRDRTWPAFAVSLTFIAIWFSQSVMPYRLPSAVDYACRPALQILHVEKRGLQLHEMCIKVNAIDARLDLGLASIWMSRDDRRLFQYRFPKKTSHSDQLPPSLTDRIRDVMESPEFGRKQRDTVKPLRAWSVDGWYVTGQDIGIRAYTTDTGQNPPQEIVDLFHELQNVPRSAETQQKMRDICLGFCYDPLSALGWLYVNHRCFNDGQGQVCR